MERRHRSFALGLLGVSSAALVVAGWSSDNPLTPPADSGARDVTTDSTKVDTGQDVSTDRPYVNDAPPDRGTVDDSGPDVSPGGNDAGPEGGDAAAEGGDSAAEGGDSA